MVAPRRPGASRRVEGYTRADYCSAMQRISVVIASYNAAAYIGEALESVRRQTLPVHETIVVDDCSTDDSAAIAERLGARVFRQSLNSGPAAARNRGIAAATGDVIACLDADDWWDPNHCETVAPLLDRFPEAAVAFSRVRFVGSWSGENPKRIPELQPVDAFWEQIRGCIPPMMSTFVRKATVLACGGYDERQRFAEDLDLFLRIAHRHPFVCTHAVTANYRLHPGQMTASPHRNRLYGWQARLRFLERARLEEEPQFIARLESAYREVLAEHLREAFRSADPAVMREFVAVTRQVPGAEELGRRWQRYGRLWWLVRMWDSLPLGLRARLRGIIPQPQ